MDNGSGASIPEGLPMVGPPSDENQMAAFFAAEAGPGTRAGTRSVP